MNSTFYKLLDNTLDEVRRREPAYTSSFPLAVAPEKMASLYSQHPVCGKLSFGAIEKALGEGLSYVGRAWTRAEQPGSSEDPVAQVLCDSIVDAFCADQGLLALEPHTGDKHSMVEVLERHYSKRQTPGGVTYFVRNDGGRPLLVVNATGAPIAIWNRFFADMTHNFKIILPQRRGNDLFRGGLQQHVEIRQDSEDLASILDAESLAQCDLLAWCNGARVAIDLANYRPSQISSMVLLGPMIKGIQGVPPVPSNFERDLQPLLDAVSKKSSLAPSLAKSIARQPASPDWKRWANAPASRAQALFAMPAREHASAMTAMLTEAQSFINIARRVASDESYPMSQALGKLQTRAMVIMGSYDNIVSNQLFSSAMKKMCRNSISKVVLKGSGHYIQDLQYHYFRWLLNEFFEKHQWPPSTARAWVEDLPRCV
jgi:pimeloyl-ACP methyl ester carboxylesterase